jgi:2-polyprenyl-6-methoxyphenol hydroxylase-like FAD-dependent oxidoreductase
MSEAEDRDRRADVDCCIVGGGPAGMVLGLLLARVGLSVTVLESQPDFDRDFRGDTLHASTLEMLDQIGLADRVLSIPHARLREMSINAGDATFTLARFDRLPSPYPFIAIMPQADFLEFLAGEASRFPGFRCLTSAGVTGLVEAGGRVCGVRYRHDGAEHGLSARLVVAADGRFSRVRKLAGFEAEERAAPMDVCWFRLPREPGDGYEAGGFFVGSGRMLICIPRVEEWQIGYHLLNVKADCLRTWHRPGLLLIGDAAHVMSPVGGVGINAAISDAVEAANVLAYEGERPALGDGPPDEAALARIQRRRDRPTRIIQTVQSRVQQLLVERALSGKAFQVPWPVRLLLRTPGLRQLPIRVFALGVSRTRLAL